MDQQIIPILTSAFGGSCLGALITGIVNWRLSNKSYKDDYYKKVLDKRIEAYEKVEYFIDHIFGITPFIIPDYYMATTGCERLYHTCFTNLETFDKALDEFSNLSKYLRWTSKEVKDTLGKINKKTSDLDILIHHPDKEKVMKNVFKDFFLKYTAEDEAYLCVVVGCKNYTVIESLIDELRKIIYRDYINMYDVKAFLKEETEY